MPPRAHLEHQRLSRRYQSRLTATERSLWVCRLREREQLAEPTCYAAIQYVLLGRLLALPAEVLARFPSHQCPPFWEILEVAGEGHPHSIDEDIVLHVRNPTPAHYSSRPAGRAPCCLGDEPIRGYVPLLMRSWIMQA